MRELEIEKLRLESVCSNVMNACGSDRESGQLLVKTTLVASSGDLPVTGDGKSSLNR